MISCGNFAVKPLKIQRAESPISLDRTFSPHISLHAWLYFTPIISLIVGSVASAQI